MSSTSRFDRGALHHHPDLPLPVEIRGFHGARRLRLRLDEKRKLLKLTGPLRMNRRLALAWAVEQSGWVEDQIRRMLPDEPFAPGAVFPLEGRDVTIAWAEAAPRTPVLDGDRLLCGGPRTGLERQIGQFLKRRALQVLSEETRDLAASAGLDVRTIAIGDAATRWGSCSSDGRIRYSWRLILAPPDARRYVVAHEVAHLAHLDHGPDFRRLERQLFGQDVTEARNLLRGCGQRLQRIGRRG